mmetsp:Transcript_2522/g.9516  ORF Transcript_2522/g.9516 Transcript_2522/m.9516 type:complete len:194 (-) Transcript_2522:1142-1723(-)
MLEDIGDVAHAKRLLEQRRNIPKVNPLLWIIPNQINIVLHKCHLLFVGEGSGGDDFGFGFGGGGGGGEGGHGGVWCDALGWFVCGKVGLSEMHRKKMQKIRFQKFTTVVTAANSLSSAQHTHSLHLIQCNPSISPPSLFFYSPSPSSSPPPPLPPPPPPLPSLPQSNSIILSPIPSSMNPSYGKKYRAIVSFF